MVHSLKRAMIRGVFAAGLAVTLVSAAWAGGSTFGSDEADDKDAGPPFFGVVKDKDGKVVADAKITATIAKSNSTLVLRADSQGHFFVRGFDKSIDPNDVAISCSKENYHTTAGVKAPATGSAPIEVICVLDHE
jgi:hypothetical protein